MEKIGDHDQNTDLSQKAEKRYNDVKFNIEALLTEGFWPRIWKINFPIVVWK